MRKRPMEDDTSVQEAEPLSGDQDNGLAPDPVAVDPVLEENKFLREKIL